MKWKQNNASIQVDTGREGALAFQGHDLRFEFQQFEVTFDENLQQLTAVVEIDSIAYLGAINSKGDLEPDKLSKSDQTKVTCTARDTVLQVKKFSTARFHSNLSQLDDSSTIEGVLTLHGVDQVLNLDVYSNDAYYSTRFHIKQSDFNIKPYSAFLGALKVSDSIVVNVILQKQPQIS